MQHVTGQGIDAVTRTDSQRQALGPGAVEIALVNQADIVQTTLLFPLQRQATVQVVSPGDGAERGQAPRPSVAGQR